MKTKYIYLLLIGLFVMSCEKEKVDAPVAEFDLQAFDLVQNNWITMEKPYVVSKAQVEKKGIRVLSKNNSEYNSFYPGDTIRNAKDVITMYRVYSPTPNKMHQGLSLVLDKDLKKGVVILDYKKVGVYKVTFVATAVGNNSNDMAISVNDKETITVIP